MFSFFRITSTSIILYFCFSATVLAQNNDLLGAWEDESGAIHLIGYDGEDTVVAGVLDWDNEALIVLDSSWENGQYSWAYIVPSTSYIVTIKVQEIRSNELLTTWSNSSGGAGSEVYIRVNRQNL